MRCVHVYIGRIKSMLKRHNILIISLSS